jgi:predicted DNA-binding protein YlxM (UPF0122 family)
LQLPPFKSEHVKTILSVSEERNSYFHYKWKNDPSFHEIIDLEKEEKIRIEKMKKIKSVIRYLKNYETKLEYEGKKKKIVKVAL